MKNFKFYLVAGLMTLSTSAFAQFANTGNNNGGTRVIDTENYDRVEISYAPTNISGESMSGFAIGYTHGFSISKTYPLFIETGVNLNYASKSYDQAAALYSGMVNPDDLANLDWENIDFSDLENIGMDKDGDLSAKITKMALNIPVNVAYKFTLNNSDISVVPYLGLNLKFNIIGKMKTEYKGEKSDYIDTEALDMSIDMFSKDDMPIDDARWSRFQIGWHIGAGVNYKALYAGLRYGTDFTELCKGCDTSSWAITLGYNF